MEVSKSAESEYLEAPEAKQLSSTSILKETPVQVNENNELSVVHVAEIPLTNSATLIYYMHLKI